MGTITIEHQLKRGGEVVAQMEAERLLHVEGRPSGEVALTRGWPCAASVGADMGAFSGIRAHKWLTVAFDL